ncbi:MAG: glycosyltransferase [Clostridia bacterium]|nr:glycosyltransferase [Clostridia bacterium]
MKFSVIIPMYNESSIIDDTLRTLTSYLEEFCRTHSHSYLLLFSDDGSADDCSLRVTSAVPSLQLANGEVRVVKADRNYGKGHAVTLGMANAEGDFALYTDCDLAYGTEVIGQAILKMIENPSDILIGSRNMAGDGYEGYTFLRKLASKTYIKVLAFIAGFKLSDSQCGFKVFRREVGQALFAANGTNGWAFDIEIILRADHAKYSIQEMPVKIINHRESKIHLIKDSTRMVKDVLQIRKRLKKEWKSK